MTRLVRPFAVLALLVGLSTPAHAQAPAPAALNPDGTPVAATESSGDPLYGYLAYGFLAALAIFVVCKSSRRS